MKRTALLLLLLLATGCGAALASPVRDPDGDRRVAEFLSDARTDAAPAPAVAASCEALPFEQWPCDSLLEIHEATTCRYRVTWLGWSPPRDYDYVADDEGWIHDYFIESAHGWVFWNLRTGDVVVRSVADQPPLDEATALRVASWAQATNFPALDPRRTRFLPTLGDRPYD